MPTVIAYPRGVSVEQLEPDATGGVWFGSDLEPGGGHVDPSGRVTLLRGIGRTTDVDLAPDGSAWFATASCVLVRAQADGSVTRSRIAIPARQLEFDPAGGLWLASFARLQHTTLGAPAGRCDDRPPRVRIVPDPAKPISLAQLRRLGGFRITVREPFSIEGYVFDADADETIAGVDRTVTARSGRTLRVRMSQRLLRRVARHTGQPLGLTADVRDREGNYLGVEYQLRFRR